MLRVRHVARDPDDAPEVGDRSLEGSRASGVDNEPSFALLEGADEGEAEPP